MLIFLVGLSQSGKNTLAHHLESQHGFLRVHVGQDASSRASSTSLAFDSSNDFLDHVTQSWRVNYVTTDVLSKGKLVEFAKRPFVAIVSIEAPLMVRYRRKVASSLFGIAPPSLEEFVAADDQLLFGSSTSVEPLQATAPLSLDPPSTPQKSRTLLRASEPPSPTPSPSRSPAILTDPQDPLMTIMRDQSHHTLLNPYDTLPPFIGQLSLPFLQDALRPPWDVYFMRLAQLASLRSNCMKRRVGAVIVREKRVVSTGYNGTPRGVRNCNEGGCGRCNGYGDGMDPEKKSERGIAQMGVGLDECLCLHAEENALLEVGRDRVSGGGTTGAVLYCNTCPCLRCAVRIVQCGVSEVVYSLTYATDAASKQILKEGNVKIRQIPLPDL
ncbi:hypothetical protein T439DRAFT_284668 [Meredithblackwellia eburnea MCA 4105]